MNIHYVYHFGYVRWISHRHFFFGNISHRLVVKPRGACKGNSRGGMLVWWVVHVKPKKEMMLT